MRVFSSLHVSGEREYTIPHYNLPKIHYMHIYTHALTFKNKLISLHPQFLK